MSGNLIESKKAFFRSFFLYEQDSSFNDDKKDNVCPYLDHPMKKRIVDEGNHKRIFFKIPVLQTDSCCKNIQSQ